MKIHRWQDVKRFRRVRRIKQQVETTLLDAAIVVLVVGWLVLAEVDAQRRRKQ